MKRRLPYPTHTKRTLLAVPAAALMLGAAQAGTTVGLNFQAWYYDSGTTPQTVGFGHGYQTTGFPVTARAFGVAASDWTNSDPLDCQAPIAVTIPFGGTLSAQVVAPNMWQSGIGETHVGPWADPQTVAPGDYEVTWGYLDDGNTTGSSPSVTVSGLAGKFPNGYVIMTIAANGGHPTFNDVDITDGVTTNTLAYSSYYVANPPGTADAGGTVGLSAQSSVWTPDTINIIGKPKTSGKRSVLAGFIITDKPVVVKTQPALTVNQGSTLALSATVIGVGTLSYQWQHAGTNVPGATTVPFSKVATPADAGTWTLVTTNPYGVGTSAGVEVTVNQVPLLTTDLSPSTNRTYVGFNTVLSVVASGAQPLSYVWKKNGAAIPGATASSLTVSNVSTGLAGYSVLVTNLYGATGSRTNWLNVVAAPDAYTAQIGVDGPIAYWPLNETSGTLALDYSAFGRDGTPSNNPTLGAVGPRPPSYPGFSASKTAYQFDGGGGYVDCGTAPALGGTTDFTLETWVNTTSTTLARIMQQRYQNGYNGEYMLDITANGTVSFTIFGGGGYQFAFSSSTVVNDGKWHHLAAVRSGANGYIYIDGALAATASGTVRPLDASFTVGLGKDIRDNAAFYNGLMCNAAIYDKALSATRIISHYITGSGTAFTVKMTPGGIIQDTKPVGTPHPAYNYGATWLASSGPDTSWPTPITRSGVEKFSAAGTKLLVPASTDFDSPTGTILFWMRASAPIPGPGNSGAMLVDRRTTAGTVIVLNDSGAIGVQCAGGANEFTVGYLPDDNWHLVALTYDQSASGSITVYIDNQAGIPNPNTYAWSWPTNQPIEIGRSHDPYWKRYDGLMDDFRIYNRILTESEIAQVYSTGALVDTAALKLRYNFDSVGTGQTLTWPFGALESTPVLGPSATWAPVPGAMSPWPIMLDGTGNFYRAVY